MFDPVLFAALMGSTALFSPSSLFSAGEQGAWYDPSDLSTMFQNSAGTTPVTAVEQPVGLILDKSKGLVLGAELVTNGDFSSGTTGWQAYSGGTTISNVSGTLRQEVVSGSVAYSRPVLGFPTVIGRTYRLSYSVAEVGAGATGAKVYAGSVMGNSINGVDPTGLNAAGTVTAHFLATATTYYLTTQHNGAVGTFSRFDNISLKELPGNHASQSTEASRPMLRQEAGGQYYLAFDGSDDSLATGTIDFSATDKMSVFAGVRKLGTGMIYELSNSADANNGSFRLYSGEVGAGDTAFALLGTQVTKAITSAISVPVSQVLTASLDIAGATRATEIFPRINGSAATFNGFGSADAGTGSFGNYPLYVGRRGGSSLPFNGRLYSLIVRGALSTDAHIASTETWVNGKTGAY